MTEAIEIETQRLGLRRLVPADAGPFTEAVNDPRVYRMLASVPPGQTKAQTLAWIATQARQREENTGHYFIIAPKSGEPSGIISATRASPQDPFEIGYWLMPPAWGKGYCTEAGDGLIRWLENTRAAAALVAGYFADNPASGKVLRKLGFLPCGRGPMFSKGRGESSDHIMMARIA
jgi:RimJ/RimL family protein N-acetyltransferase